MILETFTVDHASKAGQIQQRALNNMGTSLADERKAGIFHLCIPQSFLSVYSSRVSDEALFWLKNWSKNKG